MKKIACHGNITYDIFDYTNLFPKEDARTDYHKMLYSAASVLEKFGANVDFNGFIGNNFFSKALNLDLKISNMNINHLQIRENFSMPFSYIIIAENNNTRSINAYRDINDNDSLTFDNYDTSHDYILTDGKYPKAYLELKEKNPNAITIIDAGRCKDKIIEIAKKTDYAICSEDFVNNISSLSVTKFGGKNSIPELNEYKKVKKKN